MLITRIFSSQNALEEFQQPWNAKLKSLWRLFGLTGQEVNVTPSQKIFKSNEPTVSYFYVIPPGQMPVAGSAYDANFLQLTSCKFSGISKLFETKNMYFGTGPCL